MEVKLLLATPEVAISDNAKICYGNENNDRDITSTIVHKHKHLASLRFAYATFSIEGISVACQNQIVRSSHLDFMVQSKRYVNPDKGEFSFIVPEDIPPKTKEAMQQHFDTSMALYKTMIKYGVRREDARAILPMNTSTKMRATGNLQAWWSFLKLRLDSHAQAEIRNVAVEIFYLLQKEFPKVFTDVVFKELHG